MAHGTRYPTLAFITGGAGEASDGIPPQPFETFCYDAALLQAKIHNFNIVPYTSVLPKDLFGNIVAVDKVAKHFHHGAVLEVIMAAKGARMSDHRAIATGLGICWGKDKKGQLVGGWAAEYVEYFQTPSRRSNGHLYSQPFERPVRGRRTRSSISLQRLET
jgi:arginine decarboxylase